MLAGCQGATLTSAPPTSAATGATATLTPSGVAACATPVYRSSVPPPGAAWCSGRDSCTSNTYNWPPTGLALGDYGLEVDVRNQGATATYETTTNTTYSLSVGTCAKPTLAASPTSPGPTGATVTFSSTTSACPNPLFRFWIQAGNGPWTIKQDYSTLPTFSWTRTGLAGPYNVQVDARDQAEGTSVSYDAVNNIPYQLNGCSAVSLGAIPGSPHYPSGSVTLTGTATCPGTATYSFWTKSPTGPWTMVQDYSTTNTFSWPIAGLPLGNYSLEVDVRDQGGTDTYEKVSNLPYMLSAT